MDFLSIKNRGFPNKPHNVSVTNQTNCNIVDLTIWSVKSKFPTLHLQPNATVTIPLPKGDHRFDFSFINLNEAANLTVSIATPSQTKADNGTAPPAIRGRLSPVAKV